MADQRAGNARIEHHGKPPGRDLARVEPAHRALAGAVPDFLRALEIGGVQRGSEVVVALHRGAVAGDRDHREIMMGRNIGAAKSMAGDEHHAADAGRRRGAA